MIITNRRGTWVLRLVMTAVFVAGVFAAIVGHALYAADIIGTVPMGSETAVYAGPCTVQPFQLTGTCHTEVDR